MEWLNENLDQIMTGLIAFFSVGGFGAMGLSLLKQVRTMRDAVLEDNTMKALKEQVRALTSHVAIDERTIGGLVRQFDELADQYKKALDAQLVAQKKDIEAKYNAQLDRLRMQISDLKVKLREAQHEQNEKNDSAQ